ncbi:MAG TPA: sialidase family protein, partial [Candidatus Thermoplasmatota archaeon]|nr:sialidase family protein [Candidatus Thermoplasmatota archaeon]
MLRPGLLAALLVLAPVLGGCLGATTESPQGLLPGLGAVALPLPTLKCPPALNGTCNLLATLEPERQGNEVTIAVNPTKPDNVVAGAKDYFPASAGECVWDGYYVTQDGGATFTSSNVPGSPWKLLNDPGSFAPNELTSYWCLTDPSYAFGPDGTLYMGVMAYQGDPVTGSKTGAGVLPMGGLNDWAFNRVAQAVVISHDGGDTIDGISIVDFGSFPLNFHDREWLATDPESGAIYDVWTTGLLEGNMFYRSTDGGATWGQPVFLDGLPIPDPNANTPGGLYVAAGPHGAVYVSGCGRDGPMISASRDGGATFSPWMLFAEAQDDGMEATYRSGMVCMLAVDTSDGPFRGTVYMVWSDTRNGNRDVFLGSIRGDALGSEGGFAVQHHDQMQVIQLNDDASTADQFFPAVAVSPHGIVDVAWYDRRNDP